MEGLDRGDELHRQGNNHDEVPKEDDMSDDTMDGLEDIYRQALTPLYVRSKSSVMFATIIIMNMCIVFIVSNRFTDELLRYLSSDLLPVNNTLPGTHYEARKNIWKLGLNYRNVHTCPNGCVLFEEGLASLESCPQCYKSRWMEGSNAIPAKVICHYSLILRIKRI